MSEESYSRQCSRVRRREIWRVLAWVLFYAAIAGASVVATLLQRRAP